MSELLTIGEFSRVTHLSVKALRHYDDVGLLPPADVHRETGYRLYAVAQVPAARVIRRFRELDMPLDQIKVVLTASDPQIRDRVVLEHLERMEATLAQTRASVSSLRALLEGRDTALAVERRTIPAEVAVAIRERVRWDDAERWVGEALGELHRALAETRMDPSGPSGALFSTAFFEMHVGDVTAFVPTSTSVDATGRMQSVALPAGEYAGSLHRGPYAQLDAAYAALGAYVTERAVGAEGPVRENFLVTGAQTDDPAELRTEVCWPIRAEVAS